MAHVWKSFGLALGVHIDTLNAIEENQKKVGNCLNDTLDDWLKNGSIRESDGPPSWELVVKAVANPAGGNNCALAQDIAAKYHGIFFNDNYVHDMHYIAKTYISWSSMPY